MKRRFAVVLCIAMSAFVVSCLGPRAAQEASEIADIPGPAFNIRISEYPERGAWVAGAYYRFQSLRPNSSQWVQVMEFRHDDDVPLPKENIKFLNRNVGYLFMGWKYAVTIDSAQHWTIWNAEKDLKDWRCCNYRLIRSVELQENGKGRMILNPIQGRSAEVSELITSDFGAHWSPN